jgi:hypothetical protein
MHVIVVYARGAQILGIWSPRPLYFLLWHMVFPSSFWQFSPSTYKNMYQVMCTKQKVPEYSKGHRLLQNIGSSIWNFVHVILLVPRIGDGY